MNSENKKHIAILGSTGSIGTQTLEVIAANLHLFKVEVLTAHSNAELLASQAIAFDVNAVVITDESKYAWLKEKLAHTDIKVFAGEQALSEVVTFEKIQLVLTALVGYAGLKPTIAAIKAKKNIALANKETLVVAGDLITKLAEEYDVSILPVDSEHSAIFQCLAGEWHNKIEKIYLTASGGPFRGMDRLALASKTKAQALKHPNWTMGAKISIDSASLMNKGLELIEAYHLFPVEADQLDVIVHPQSVIHSMVEYQDGSVLAQLGSPDMRTPIAYCLAFPDRMHAPVARLDFAQIGQLEFEDPDLDRFPCLRLAKSALAAGGSRPAILNAANEIAVAGFLGGQIGFMSIPAVVESVLEQYDAPAPSTIRDVLDIDEEARRLARLKMEAVAA